MRIDERQIDKSFPRGRKYNPEWILASVSGGANPVWITEWLTQVVDLRPGMRVLDLGCGRAASSIFLHKEFGVQVWATDLWFDATENLQRIRDAGAEQGVIPIHADARALPFAAGYFDAILCIDSFQYFATDEFFVGYLARFVKTQGTLAIAGAGLVQETEDTPPDHLRAWWTPDVCSLHSAAWWERHWKRTGIVQVDVADTMPDGWRLWLAWIHQVAPENTVEIQALEADAGRYLGYVRMAGRRAEHCALQEPVTSVTTEYVSKALLRGE